ncbi:MAG: hypothetical protein R3F60_33040 [bacterium]
MRAAAFFTPWADPEGLLVWLEATFGLPRALFEGHRFWLRSDSGTLWLADAATFPPPGVRLDAFGMLAFRDPPPRGRPTNVFALRFGAHATRSVLDLDAADARRLLAGEPVAVTDAGEAGWRILRGPGQVLGMGRVAEGALRSELPRSWLLDVDPATGWGDA